MDNISPVNKKEQPTPIEASTASQEKGWSDFLSHLEKEGIAKPKVAIPEKWIHSLKTIPESASDTKLWTSNPEVASLHHLADSHNFVEKALSSEGLPSMLTLGFSYTGTQEYFHYYVVDDNIAFFMTLDLSKAKALRDRHVSSPIFNHNKAATLLKDAKANPEKRLLIVVDHRDSGRNRAVLTETRDGNVKKTPIENLPDPCLAINEIKDQLK